MADMNPAWIALLGAAIGLIAFFAKFPVLMRDRIWWGFIDMSPSDLLFESENTRSTLTTLVISNGSKTHLKKTEIKVDTGYITAVSSNVTKSDGRLLIKDIEPKTAEIITIVSDVNANCSIETVTAGEKAIKERISGLAKVPGNTELAAVRISSIIVWGGTAFVIMFLLKLVSG